MFFQIRICNKNNCREKGVEQIETFIISKLHEIYFFGRKKPLEKDLELVGGIKTCVESLGYMNMTPPLQNC